MALNADVCVHVGVAAEGALGRCRHHEQQKCKGSSLASVPCGGPASSLPPRVRGVGLQGGGTSNKEARHRALFGQMDRTNRGFLDYDQFMQVRPRGAWGPSCAWRSLHTRRHALARAASTLTTSG